MSLSRIAGIIIAVSALLTLVALAHHPVVAAPVPSETLRGLVAAGTQDRLVHGALMIIGGALLFAFSLFARETSVARGFAIAGLVAYAIGTAGTFGAAILDGFVSPDVAARFAGGPAPDVAFAIQILRVCAIAIQVLTKLGIAGIATATALWSIGLLAAGRLATSVVGAAGCLVAIATVLLTVDVRLTPPLLFAIFGVQALWYLGFATLLVRRVI